MTHTGRGAESAASNHARENDGLIDVPASHNPRNINPAKRNACGQGDNRWNHPQFLGLLVHDTILVKLITHAAGHSSSNSLHAELRADVPGNPLFGPVIREPLEVCKHSTEVGPISRPFILADS